jgi:hypothetical protein
VQPPVSPRLCGHLVAETVDQLRVGPFRCQRGSLNWGVYGNGGSSSSLAPLLACTRTASAAESQGRARPSSPNKAGRCGRWLDHREGDGAKKTPGR